MGNQKCKQNTLTPEQYFEENRKKQLAFLASVNGYLENTNEWISIFRERLENYSEHKWSQDLLSSLKCWSSIQHITSKLAFALNRYYSEQQVKRVSHINVCLWKESIKNLETFSYEVVSNSHAKTLHNFLTVRSESILHQIIRVFKCSLVRTYAFKENGKLTLLPQTFYNIEANSSEIDATILYFCGVLLEIIPKFFLDMPENIPGVKSIVKDAVISADVLELLVIIRKEQQVNNENEYLKGLETFAFYKFSSGTSRLLERESNESYGKAIESMLELTQASSIGGIEDSVAMLMNHISIGLFDPKNPLKLLDDDEIIEAFLIIIIKSSPPNLPIYVDILKTFIGEEEMNMKDVGKGIIKLIFLLENIENWKSFIDN